MEKITHLSRLKIRWLSTRALLVVLFTVCMPFFQANAQTYCTPVYANGCSYGDDFNSFVITGHGTSVISDLNTGCSSAAYEDQTSLFTPVDVMQGQSYTVELNTNYAANSEYASIWIDFDDDGTFDATERLLSGFPLASNPSFSTTTIDIPFTAPVGIHRMRVRVVWSNTGAIDPCTSLSYGETHDYEVNVLPLPPCTGMPTAGTASATTRSCNSQPFTLSVTGTTVAGNMTFQWEESPAGAGTWTPITGANNTSHVVTTQTADTDYRFVITCLASGDSDTSNVVTVNQVGVITGNFFEGFENTPVGTGANNTVPDCWTYVRASGSGYGYTYNYAQRTGSNGFYAYPYSNTELLLISPETANLGNGTKQVRFWANNTYSGYAGTKLEVYTMDDATATATRTLVQTINLTNTGWFEYIVPLPATTDDYFAFSFYGATNMYPTIYLDDIYYEDIDPCIFPMNLSVSNITITDATISWSPSLGSSVTDYEYEIRELDGTVAATGLAGGATTTSVNVQGLDGATTYRVYIRSVCGTSEGPWTTFPAEFTTLCPVFTANFFEGFENTPYGSSGNQNAPNCWTNLNTTNYQYNYAYVYQYNANTGTNCFYMYRYPLSTATGDMLLISPETDNLGNGTKQIRFSVRDYNSDAKIVIYTMNGNTAASTKTLIQAIPVNNSNYVEYIVPLPVTADDYFAFSLEHNNPAGTNYPYVYIDDIHYEDLSPCIFPMGLDVNNITTNSATISWDPSQASGVSGYEYEVRTSGAAGSGATGLELSGTVGATVTSVNLTGLDHSTAYTVYIRSVCGTTNGLWSMYLLKFNTLCDVITGNFFEGFETTTPGGSNNQNAPVCWTNLNTTGYQYNYGYVYQYNARTGTNCYYNYRYPLSTAPNGDMLLISPETDNLGNGTKRLRFYARSGSTSYTPILNIYSMNGNTIMATKTLVKSIPLKSTSYEEFIVYFPITTDDYFAFSFEGTQSDYINIYLDDIYYEDAPDCKPIDDDTIQITNIEKDKFNVSWLDLYNTNPVAYEVEVRETGAPGTSGAAFTTTTAVGVMSATVTGLDPSIKYRVYVRAKCSPTDSSDWNAGVDATTLCDYPDLVSYTQSLALCGPQKVHLSTVLDDAIGSVFWYDTATDMEPIFEGEDFVSEDDVTQDRSFWLRTGAISPGVDIQIGEGTITDQYNIGNFLYNGWGGYRHQYIFTAEELTEAGLTAGPISALKFDIVNVGTAPRPDFSIAIGATTNATAGTPLVSNSSLHQAYGPVSQTFTLGINTFTFATPYIWDGMSDLVVQTNWSTGSYGNNYGAVKLHTTSPNRTTYLFGDNLTASQLLATDVPISSPYIGSGTTNSRPNTTFVGTAGCMSPMIEIPITVSPKPDFELSSYKVTSCEGGVSELVTITTNLGGYDTFVWTPSTGVSGNATSGWTFTTPVEQEYTLTVSQSSGICEHIKTVLVFSGVEPEANPNLATLHDVCANDITELNVLEELPGNVTFGMQTTATSATSEVSAFVQSEIYSKQQYIYSANELIALGVDGAGFITGLDFNTINSGASFDNANYTIKMMADSNTSFANSNFVTGDFTTVYTRPVHTHIFQGWQQFAFDNPFYWDGQSNIIVQITMEGMGDGANNAQTYYTAVTGNNVGLYATSETDPDPATGTRTTNRLDARFSFEQSNVTWSPATNLFVDAAATIPYTSGQNALTVYHTSSQTSSQVYTATLAAPSGCVTTEYYTINSVAVGTPVVASQTFCEPISVSNIVVTGHQGAPLNFYNSATSTTPITTISQSGTYYVQAGQGDCISTRVSFSVSIVTLANPTVTQFTQVVCGTGTIADLTATATSGAQIQWYSSATSTTPLPSTQALVNNTTYYAAQTMSGCVSG